MTKLLLLVTSGSLFSGGSRNSVAIYAGDRGQTDIFAQGRYRFDKRPKLFRAGAYTESDNASA